GAPGFEPGTSRTPSVRATRLRYAPTDTKAARKVQKGCDATISRLSPAFEQGQESAQRIAQIQKHFSIQKLRRAMPRRNRRSHLVISPAAIAQMPPRSRNRKPFVIQQPLDLQHHVHIFLPVKSMPARTLDRLQHRKFRLPIT